ncbi:LicD family protein [Halomonas sp. BC1]|uniref:LicD family protein n=1 Tax=Halomonas sp. BC1 TaxID=1670448 RepID=UPI0009C10A01|nr:LicD family protein [Halomonas sp. BC1]
MNVKEYLMQCEYDEVEKLYLSALVKNKRVDILNFYLEKSNDKIRSHSFIQSAIDEIEGPGFVLTGHGISRSLRSRYDSGKLKKIFRLISEFQKSLKDELNIESFVTSGTLLGIVRDNDVIAHDDDFDLAYISNFSSEEEIILERRRIYDWINSCTEFEAKDCAGGHFWIYYKTDSLNFMFDLFLSWVKDGFLNEFPLDPKKIKAESILPLKMINFYESEIFIPKDPASLLDVNYGSSWRVPDPSFRFDFGKNNSFYWFLLKNKIENN